MAAALSTIG